MLWRRKSGTLVRASAHHVLEPYVAESLLSTLTTLGLTANLKLCLDAGEGDSYTSGQKWLDLSGGGYDFFLGADVTATTDDPAFNGVADALSSAEFWSFDGGDYFTYDTTNETWMNNLHKDGALYTLAGWLWPVAGANNWLFANSGNSGTNVGVAFGCSVDSTGLFMNVSNGATLTQYSTTAAGTAAGAWQFFACSVNESGSYILIRNGQSVATGSATVASPSAAAATYTVKIGSNGNAGTGALPNTAKIGMVAAFDTNLTQWQLEQIYNKTRRRFSV